MKRKYPYAVLWSDAAFLLTCLQKDVTENYNKAITNLYIETVKKNNKFSDRIVDYLLSSYAYPEAYSKFKNSNIALGIRQKIKSGFSGKVYKELIMMKRSLPTAKSDTFPIPFYIQNGFKIREVEGNYEINGKKQKDIIIEIPFPKFKIRDNIKSKKGGKIIEYIKEGKLNYIPFILITKRRKKKTRKDDRDKWLQDEGTNAEIRKVISGDYKVNYAEIKPGKRFGEKRKWFVNLAIKYDVKPEGLDKNLVGGIDVGVKNPIRCAINNSPARYSVEVNDLWQFHRKRLSRRRDMLKKNAFKRSGHGSKNKLLPITKMTEKSELFRKSIMQRWAKETATFFRKEKVSIVHIEDLSSNMKQGTDFFNIQMRTSWPVKQMMTYIVNKLKEFGIEVREVNPRYSSQICSKCGIHNEYFDQHYRRENNWPLFKCQKCGYEDDADYNAARNLSNKDYEKFIENAIKNKV